MALTDVQLRSAKPTDKSYKLYDGNGLYVMVNPCGSKLWRMKYQYRGKGRTYCVGRYPDIGLKEAREICVAQKKLLSQGTDPNQQKKTTKYLRMAASENTLEILARRWLDIKRIEPSHKERSLRRLELYAFPRLGDRPVQEITTVELVDCLEAIERKNVLETAHRVKQLLQQVFRYAVRKGLLIHNPASDLRDMLAYPQKNNFACIPVDELPALLKAMKGYNGDYLTCAAMQMLALAFVRTGELRAATWDEINWERAEWHIPAHRMKKRRDHVVPLSRQALAILHKLQFRTGRQVHIFHKANKRLKYLSESAVLNALRKMGYAGRMTGHGFRALASTILNEQRVYHPDVIEKQLAHADRNEVRAAYNRADYLPERKRMMQDWADFLDRASERADNITDVDFNESRMIGMHNAVPLLEVTHG